MNRNVSLPKFKSEFVVRTQNSPRFIVDISHFSSAVEQLIRNQQVEGSNPLSGSIKVLSASVVVVFLRPC